MDRYRFPSILTENWLVSWGHPLPQCETVASALAWASAIGAERTPLKAQAMLKAVAKVLMLVTMMLLKKWIYVDFQN